VQERKEKGNFLSIIRREKSSVGENPKTLRVEIDSLGSWVEYAVERVAKP